MRPPETAFAIGNEREHQQRIGYQRLQNHWRQRFRCNTEDIAIDREYMVMQRAREHESTEIDVINRQSVPNAKQTNG